MYFLQHLPDGQRRYTEQISTSASWENWVYSIVPQLIDRDVRIRLVSNLKHIIVGLEMKAALIVPHHNPPGNRLLFEPYAQILTFEFCVGVFSVCEGLGTALYLDGQFQDGSENQKIGYNRWHQTLVRDFDACRDQHLADNLATVKSVRDKLHQDNLAARQRIDWHELGYEEAFIPGLRTIQTLFNRNEELIPDTTNLTQRL